MKWDFILKIYFKTKYTSNYNVTLVSLIEYFPIDQS